MLLLPRLERGRLLLLPGLKGGLLLLLLPGLLGGLKLLPSRHRRLLLLHRLHWLLHGGLLAGLLLAGAPLRLPAAAAAAAALAAATAGTTAARSTASAASGPAATTAPALGERFVSAGAEQGPHGHQGREPTLSSNHQTPR